MRANLFRHEGNGTNDSHADPVSGQTEVVSLIAGEVDPFLSAGLVNAGNYARRQYQ